MKRLLCLIGRHTGQKEGGTMMYTCPRCRKALWQRYNFSAVTARADRMIEHGCIVEAACEYAQEEIARRA